ncbi:hypothetical protein [Nitrospirillum iridis]|uniref:Uncharacterized protein n=1 Tax=Nitrospirillum iridis TaxID=765888 RepID=A0A7X0AWN2_9PROT|nr:hypothetical protein [Nitrospirillum iridis]MBB6251435.1 hypothetical protein [Nitrospirillum iridis]
MAKKTPKTDVTDELIASLQEAVGIMDGTLAPGRAYQVEVPDLDVKAAGE